jgi:hypothetical protein
MYGLEPTDGVAYNAYMPILQSAFAVSGPSPTTTTSRTSTTTSKATTAPTTTTRATSASSTKTTSSSPAPTGNCAAKYGQCGVSIKSYRVWQLIIRTDHIPRALVTRAQLAASVDLPARRRTTTTRSACRERRMVDFKSSCSQEARSRSSLLNAPQPREMVSLVLRLAGYSMLIYQPKRGSG